MSSRRHGLRSALALLPLLGVGCVVDTPLFRNDAAMLPDVAVPCSEGALVCTSGDAFRCSGGALLLEESCEDACIDGVGCTDCVVGERRCDGSLAQFCDGGSFRTVRDCSEWGSECNAGRCGDACDVVDSQPSYEGCEFFPTTLPSEIFEEWPRVGRIGSVADQFDIRIVITNPGDEPAEVVLERRGTRIDGIVVAPHELGTFSIPYATMGRPYTTAGTHLSLVVSEHAYRLRSSRPVVVSQFSPFELRGTRGALSASQDASLLFPSNALGRSYVGLSSANFTFGLESRPAYVAVIGASLEPVTVRIRPGDVAIANERNGTFGRIAVGGEGSVVLERGDVALLLADRSSICTLDTCQGQLDGDPTGVRIDADGPVAVIGGHLCGSAPGINNACDHLEEQIPPISTLGRTYAGTALVRPGTPGMQNVLRVVAPLADTTVELTIDGVTTTERLFASEHLDRPITGAFRVQATQRVLVALYMVSAPGDRVGAPSLTTVPPIEQYRSDYAFVAPSSYRTTLAAASYVALERSAGVAIRLDGVPLEPLTPWQTREGRESAIVVIPPGAHALSSEEPFGALLFGIGDVTSYALPVGLDLSALIY